MADLKPCPWCGELPSCVDGAVWCNDPTCPGSTVALHVGRWNTRHIGITSEMVRLAFHEQMEAKDFDPQRFADRLNAYCADTPPSTRKAT